MCEVPARSWRDALSARRIVFGLAALASITVGLVISDAVGVGFLVFGAALFLLALLLPTINEIEFGLPVGLKVTAAVHARETDLRDAFEQQRGDLELCAQLLCDDPATAAKLLEAAWSQAAVAWRGPADDALRIYVLCALVHLVGSHERWVTGAAPTVDVARSPLAELPPDERAAVVLHEFAGLPSGLIAQVTGRPVEDVREALRAGGLRITARGAP